MILLDKRVGQVELWLVNLLTRGLFISKSVKNIGKIIEILRNNLQIFVTYDIIITVNNMCYSNNDKWERRAYLNNYLNILFKER